MGVTVQAQAKLLILGEHAAVYGHPALGLSLPWGLRVAYTPQPGWDFPPTADSTLLEDLVRQFQSWRQGSGLPLLSPGRLTITSEIPQGSGFGSSAALCAALSRLFFPQTAPEAWDHWAWQAEHRFHGTPSGIDTSLALRSGTWALWPHVSPPRVQPLARLGWSLVVGAVQRLDSTRNLIAQFADAYRQKQNPVYSDLTQLGRLAAQALDGWAPDHHLEIGRIIRQARHHLQALGLETPALRQALDAGLAHGALAGKLSGAGGGGAFFLLFPEVQTATAALPAIQAAVPAADWTFLPRLLPEAL